MTGPSADGRLPLVGMQPAYVTGGDPTLPLGGTSMYEYREYAGSGVDPDRLRRALAGLARRHEALRVRVDEASGSQRVSHAAEGIRFEWMPDGRVADARERLSTASPRVDAPPVQVVLIGDPAGEQRLLIGVDAMSVDGAGVAALLAEGVAHYRDPDGARPSLVSYETAVGRPAAAASTVDERYWDGRMATMPPPPALPWLRSPASAVPSGGASIRRRRVRAVVPGATWSAVTAGARARGLFDNAVALVATADAVAAACRRAGADGGFRLGIPLGRPRAENDPVGPFSDVTVVTVPAELAGVPAGERAGALQRELFRSIAHRGIGGMEIARRLAVVQGDRSPVLPVCVTNALGWGDERTLGGLRLTEAVTRTPQVAVDVRWSRWGDDVAVGVDYAEAVLRTADAEALVIDAVAAVTALADPAAWDREELVVRARPAAVAASRTADDGARRRRELMAALLAKRGLAAAAEPREEPPAVDRGVLSPAEERMWMLDQLDPAAATGTLVTALWLDGVIDDDRLLDAVRRVVVEFPALRTVYRTSGGGGGERVVPVELSATGLDLAIEPVADDSAAIARAVALGSSPFDLTTDRPIRARILRVDPTHAMLVLAGHHIAIDDSAWPTIADRIARHYVSAGAEDPAVDGRYRAYAAACAAREGTPAERRRLEYWRRLFPEPPTPLRLPSAWRVGDPPRAEAVEVTGFPIRPRVQGSPGRVRYERAGGQSFAATARALGAPRFHLEVAVLAAILATVTGERRLVLASPVVDLEAGADGEAPIGATGNLVPIVVDVPEGVTFGALLRTVSAACGGAVANSAVPVERILGAVGAAGTRPFPVTVLTYRSFADELDLPGVTVTAATLPPVAAVSAVTLALELRDRGIAAEVTYDGSVRTTSARELLEEFVRIADTVATDPAARDRSIARLVALPAAGSGERRAAARPAGPTADGRLPGAGHDVVEIVRAVLAAVVPDGRLGPDDDFFAAGGHSLAATRAAVRLRGRFEIPLGIGDVFDHPTPRDLARVVESRRRGEPAHETAAVDAPPGGDTSAVPEAVTVPLAPAQRRLWVLESVSDLGDTYTIPIMLRLDAPAGRAAAVRDALAAAVRDVVARHDVLRSVIVAGDAGPERTVLADGGLADRLAGLTGVTEVADDEAAEAEAHRFARGPVDLGSIPVRTRIVTVDGVPRWCVIVVHHIALDEWSTALLLDDLGRCYAARCAGVTPPPANDPLGPRSYAAYARGQIDGTDTDADRAEADLAFWERELAGAPGEIAVLDRRDRPVDPGHAGGWVPVTVPAAVTSGLRGLAQKTGASLFVVVETAVAAALRALGAGSDVPIVTPVSGRDDPRFEDTVGLFVNTVVLRHRFADDPTADEAVRRARASLLAAVEHSAVPFERVVERLAPERSTARNPLAQIMVQVHDEDGLTGVLGAGRRDAVGYRAADPGRDTAKFDVTVELLVPSGEGDLQGGVGYHAALYTAEQGRRIADTVVAVLAAMAADPSRRVSSLVPVAEPAELIGPPAPPPGTVPEFLIPGSARRLPGAPALVADRVLTGERLDEEISRVRAALVAAGAGPGRHVAVLVDRTADTAIAVLAAALSGAAVAPLVTAPAAFVERGLDRIDPVVVIAPAGVSVGDRRVVRVADAVARPAVEPAAVAPTPAHTAYLLFTSGTSGPPKAVVGSQRALAARLRWARDGFDPVAATGRVWLQFSRLTFVDGLTTLLGAYGGGHTLVVPSDDEVSDLHRLAALGTRWGVDTATVVPTVLAAMLRAIPDAVASIPHWVSSGERLDPALRDRFAEVAPDSTLVDSYGQTEGAGDDLRIVCRPGPAMFDVAAPGVHAMILDESGRPVPSGVVGDLHTSGVQLADGYLGDPRETARRFVAAEGGVRLYRTGDRARLGDGGIVLCARGDGEVKVRGVRVDLAAVEYELTALDGVEAAVAAGVPGVSGQRLGACVRAPGMSPAEVVDAARRALPDHLVPTLVSVVADVPRTHTGKPDRRRAAESLSAAIADRGSAAPRPGVESELAEVFGEVLGRSSIGREDDFFARGGDSMGVIDLVARARGRGLVVGPQEVFRYPTIAELASIATRADVSAPSEAGFDEPAPLSASGLADDELAALLDALELNDAP